MLADGRPNGAAEWLLAVVGALTVTGILPMAVASLLIWLVEPLPSWAVVSGIVAVVGGAAAWAWRAL